MAFKAHLDFENTLQVRVLDCEFGFTQDIDSTGKPTSRPRGSIIKLVLESTNDLELVAWMFSHSDTKDGTISFLRRDNEAAMKKVSFKDGICISYHESFKDHGAVPMTTAITISAREIHIDGLVFENKWHSE